MAAPASHPSFLLANLAAAVSPAGEGAPLRGDDLGRVLVFEPAAIAVVDGRIAAVGTPDDVRSGHADLEVVDGREKLLGSGRFATDQAGYTAMANSIDLGLFN